MIIIYYAQKMMYSYFQLYSILFT